MYELDVENQQEYTVGTVKIVCNKILKENVQGLKEELKGPT